MMNPPNPKQHTPITFKKEISLADLIKLAAAAIAIFFFANGYYVEKAQMKGQIEYHSKRIAEHDDAIKKLAEVTLRQQVLMEERFK